jgi:hypothetical protein
MLSSVYQEASAGNPAYAEKDPDNKLQWRYNVRQLDFEQMHDSILAIAGTIDLTMGGQARADRERGLRDRRAVYAFIDRRNPAEILTQFNFPNPSVPTGKRFLTQVPQQQLFLMNSPLVIETARKLVHSPDFMSQTTDELRVHGIQLHRSQHQDPQLAGAYPPPPGHVYRPAGQRRPRRGRHLRPPQGDDR